MARQPIPVAVKPVEEAKEKGLREQHLVARVSRRVSAVRGAAAWAPASVCCVC